MEQPSHQDTGNSANKKKQKELIKTTGITELIYVKASELHIRRIIKNGELEYINKGKKITYEKELKRIEALAIPPAWEKVRICEWRNGHLQATGYDKKQRKQYIYHPLWIRMRGETKFHRLYHFGKKLPYIRRNIWHDLHQSGLPERKVLATLLRIMEQTNIRIGNRLYNKLYGSYGLSTLRGRHVKLKGGNLRFTFKGKKGKAHDISIHNRRLASTIKNCKEIPGKQLFQYYDEEGEKHSIHSEEVNAYIKEISGESFTSKDFRTWAGTVECVRTIHRRTRKDKKKVENNEIKKILDEVASRMGNTRAVCKKYYVHPIILETLKDGRFEKYFSQIKKASKWLDIDERIVLKILKSKQGS